MRRDRWIPWDWQTHPDAPLDWYQLGRTVAIVDGLHAQARQVEAQAATLHAAAAAITKAIERGLVAIFVDAIDVHRFSAQVGNRWPVRSIPAMRIERQRDLATANLSPLMSVNAVHRALVLTPREAIDLDPATCETCGARDGEGLSALGDDGATPFCVEHEEEMGYGTIIDPCASVNGGVDLVIVRGQLGDDARPMSLDWVRKIRDQCKERQVAFAFLGWGSHVPKGQDRDLLDRTSHLELPEDDEDEPGLALVRGVV